MAAVDRQKTSDGYARAVRHPRRRDILRMAVAGGGTAVSPGRVSGRLDIPLASIAYHFRVLVEGGVLRARFARPREGTVENFYKPTPAALAHPIVAAALEEHGLGRK